MKSLRIIWVWRYYIMEKLSSILLVAALLVFFSENTFAHVTLLYPVGGETFQVGEVVTVQWEIAIYHGACNWDLFFSSDGGSTWQAIATDLPEAQLSYNWTVPNSATDSARIKVTQDNVTWHANFSDSSGNFTINLSAGIGESRAYSKSFNLYPAYPNPFNPVTTIRFDIAKGSKISLGIYNIVGEKIRTLVDNFQSAGSKSVVWDGRNDSGQLVSSGIYMYRLQSGSNVLTKKMVLLK